MGANHDWKTMLPSDGAIGVCPQVGRVRIPPVAVRPTLTLTAGRRIKGVRACWFEGEAARFVTLVPATGRIRRDLETLRGGETVEFVGRPCEWHDMAGGVSYVVIVNDMHASAGR